MPFDDQPLNILYLVWEYPPKLVGGLGTYATEMTRKFVERGHNVVVFTMNKRPEEGDPLPTRELYRGVEVHRPLLLDASDILPSFVADDLRRWGPHIRFFADIMLYNILSASKVVNDLVPREGRRFDLVVAHDWLSIMGGMLIKKALNIPLVFHVHSTEHGRMMGGGSAVVKDLEYRGGQAADMVITVSYAMRQELVSLGFQEKKIYVCHNGVDPQKYDPTNVDPEEIERLRNGYGIGPDGKMVLFIGRLETVKGPDRLIAAFPMVLEKVPNAKLVMIGVGAMQNYLHQQVESLGIKDKVIFIHKFISESRRILHYAACDVAVFPSLYEPFGIVALEAMSMAKPVVVGDVGGLRESVVHGETGYHVDPHRPETIADAVIKILSDPELATQMGERGRLRVLKHFTWDRVADNTLDLYRLAVSSGG